MPLRCKLEIKVEESRKILRTDSENTPDSFGKILRTDSEKYSSQVGTQIQIGDGDALPVQLKVISNLPPRLLLRLANCSHIQGYIWC